MDDAGVAAQEAANRQNVLDAGGVIRELTDQQRQAWVDTMASVWDQFRADIGDDLIAAAVGSNSTDAM